MEKIIVQLVIERGDNDVWGHVKYSENLLVECGKNLTDLSIRMKASLQHFENLDPAAIEFSYAYNIHVLFKKIDFLNTYKVAQYAGIRPELLQQYINKEAYPSAEHAKMIEDALHRLASELSRISICAV